MFGWEFPPFNSGGLGVACYGLTRSLAKLGAKIVFVLPKNLGACSEYVGFKYADSTVYLKNNKISFRELEAILYPYIDERGYKEIVNGYEYAIKPEFYPYAKDLYSEVLRYGALSRRIAANEDFDVIHAHDWLSYPAGMEAKRISGKKLVSHIHATEFDRTGWNGINKQVYAIERQGLRSADTVVAVSNQTRRVVIDKYGLDPHKVEVVHNGIDLDYFEQPDREEEKYDKLRQAGYKMVLFLGRLTIQKGPDYFIQAAQKVIEYDDKVFFLMVGSGDMKEELMHKAAACGIGDKVLFGGWMTGKDLARAYQAADLFVMPSVSEPFGITVLESMINHTPVLVSRQSGVAEVVRNVLKADFWDTEEMANKILSVLEYDSLHRHLQVEGRKEVEGVSWAKAAEKCMDLYQRLCAIPA
jgi:glycosyltransferase involved in cell wall biosynthesis